MKKRQNYLKVSCSHQGAIFLPAPPASRLTFDHDHVDIDGADGGLRQPLASPQHRGDLAGRDAVVWLGAERHDLPHRHTCRPSTVRADSVLGKTSVTQQQTR